MENRLQLTSMPFSWILMYGESNYPWKIDGDPWNLNPGELYLRSVSTPEFWFLGSFEEPLV